jgi:hypothetical protein
MTLKLNEMSYNPTVCEIDMPFDMGIRSALKSRWWLNYEANKWNSVLNEDVRFTKGQDSEEGLEN